MNSDMDKDKLWGAYLDGQLSPSEAVAFEATLTPDERALCAQEMRLENALAEQFREPVTCPDALWQKASAQLAPPPVKVSWLGRPVVAVPAFLGLAAALALTFFQTFSSPKHLDPILMLPQSVADAAKSSGTPLGDAEAVKQFFVQRHIHLAMDSLNGVLVLDNHPIHLLGASERGCHGKSVVEIYFECCNEPSKVLIAERDTDAADVLREASRAGDTVHFREMGEYVAAVVSDHHAPDLTRFFAPAGPQLAASDPRSLLL